MKRLACVLLALALFGCATTPISFEGSPTEEIEKIAIVTNPIKDKFLVLNHLLTIYGLYTTPAPLAQIRCYLPISRRPSYTGSPGLLPKYVLERDSLGGSPKVLKDKIGTMPIEKHIDKYLIEQLSKRYHIAESSYFLGNIQQETTAKDKKISEYISHCKEIGADTLLAVDFLYGLAVYTGATTREMASAAIDAIMTVYDVKTEKILLEKVIFSDLYFKEGFGVDEYAADDAKLFKENIAKAARGLSLLIGYEFGIDVEYIDKTKRVLPVDVIHVSCKKPYILEQDCSSLKNARRKIEIDGYGCKIAGSNDGRVILIKTPAKISEASEEELRSPTSHLLTKANNTCLELISRELTKHNINILKKVEIKRYPETAGYFLELDGNGYAILKQYTK